MNTWELMSDAKRYPANHTRRSRAELFAISVYDEKSDRSQCDYLLEYLEKYGSITQLEALWAFGCMRLGARVSDLRRCGYDIATEINPKGKRYAIYRYEENANG